MTHASNLKVLIVGAGIGGLTAAVALRRAGVETTVFERGTELRRVQVGQGFHIWPNAIKGLRQLGLAEAVQAAGMQVEWTTSKTWRGNLLAKLSVGNLSRKIGAPTIGIGRPALHRILMESLGDGVVQFGAQCTGFTQDASGVTVRFADGREERGDLLIGADGARSAVRAQVLDPAPPRYSGHASWLAAVDFEHEKAPPDVLSVHFGPGTRFIFYHLSPGRVAWIADINGPEEASEPANGRRAALLQRYRGWDAPIEAMIEAADEAAMVRMPLYFRSPTKRWGDGRVTLLGDAAHLMTPDIAQGACMAIEDAVVLMKCLRDSSDPTAALREYESARMGRTGSLQRRARVVGTIGQTERPLACTLRDQFLKIVGRFQYKDFEQLFSYNA